MDRFADAILVKSLDRSRRSAAGLMLLGLLAGILTALSAAAGNAAAVGIDNAAVIRVVRSLILAAGVALCAVTGAVLFSGECLMTLSVRQKDIPLRSMLRVWGWTYLGNLTGALMVVMLLWASGIWNVSDSANAIMTIRTASEECSLPFYYGFVRGILCSVLICTGFFLSVGEKSVTARAGAVFFPAMLYALCGFEHSVANMYTIASGIVAAGDADLFSMAMRQGISLERLTVGHFLFGNLLPVTLGNLVGGVGISILFWAASLWDRSPDSKE